MESGIEAIRLSKFYGAIPAVRDVSLTVRPGQILGLLGPNGSGKSTTVSMLTGLRQPSSGHILFDRFRIDDQLPAYKARLGYVPEEAQLYPFLSGREQLELVGRLRRLPRALLARKVSSLLECFGLSAPADAAISSYSKGMRQKIVVIAALLHDPDVLILDEPESGLDLAASLTLRHLIPLLAAQGKAVLYSSHVLDYVERLCEQVVVLNHGRVIAHGPVSTLRAVADSDASLEELVTNMVTSVDPGATAADIAAVVRARA